MKNPVVYIHRAAKFYTKYMTPTNEELLSGFAEIRSPRGRETPMTAEELVQDMQGADAILSLNGIGAAEITTEVLQAVQTVKVAAFTHYFAPGCHEIAIPQWQKAGVKVIDASDVVSRAVAEWVVGAAILGCLKLDRYNQALKSGDTWPQWRGQASMLYRSTFGVAGLGRVGKVVARYLKPFCANLIGYDKYFSQEEADVLGIKRVSLHELLCTSDIISLNLPVTEETKGMIGAYELSLIREGTVLINSARATILDKNAFYEELAKNRFVAFLDVYDKEPLTADDPIRAFSNTFITPHIGGFNNAMFERCGTIGIETLKNYFGV
jgi:phosphoglycerate dehydrogenase-like enzyme